MTIVFNQDTRQGHLHTALGGDTLSLARFHGTDAVNELFAYQVEAISTSDAVDLNALVGTSASVELRSAIAGPRWFNGIVAEAAWAGVGIGGYRYDLVLRPWFWLAGLRRNQRIFHNKSVVQILQALFEPYAKHGKPALEVGVTGNYDPMEYCVQYRESDLQFARRLMERSGISFYFKHGDGTHTLVLVDTVDSLPEVAGGSRPYRSRSAQQISDDEHFWTWRGTDSVATGAIRLTDYDFKNPQAAMEVGVTGDATHENGQIESFDYPGGYLVQDDGKAIAELRAKQERASAGLHSVTGNCIGLGSGMTVQVTGKAIPFAGKSYACLRATHSFTSQSYATGGAASDAPFSASYVLAAATAPLVPIRATPVPVISGPQTAVVVGEGKIDCDEHGRILVRFHWDLQKAHSMRCRVSQSWASQGWGGMTIPRIGMEVVVEFLDGDPDWPLVTGAVYNGRNKPPYPLPAHHSKTVLRSQSVDSEGFNEITFEDKSSKENLFVHAQRSLTARVLRGRLARVGSHDVLSVGGNRSSETVGSEKHEVGKSFGVVVGGTGDKAGNAAEGVRSLAGKTAELLNGALGIAGASAGKFANSISSVKLGFFNSDGISNRAALVKDESPRPDGGAAIAASAEKMGDAVGPSLDDVEGVMHVVVASHKSESVGVSSVEQVGKARVVHVGGADFAHVAKTKQTTIGEHSVTEVGKTKKITVGDELVIEVGSARLQMKKDGTIILQGMKFNFTASGPVQINGAVVDLNKPGG